MNKKISKLQAYNIMLIFLEAYYWKNKSDNLSNIISFSQFCFNKNVVDSAMWEYWQESIILTMQEDKYLKNSNRLTILQAFNIMFNFLTAYFNYFMTIPSDIAILLNKLGELRLKQDQNNYLWQEWLKISDEVIKMKDPRVYLQLTGPIK